MKLSLKTDVVSAKAHGLQDAWLGPRHANEAPWSPYEGVRCLERSCVLPGQLPLGGIKSCVSVVG